MHVKHQSNSSLIFLAVERFGKLVKWGSRLTFVEFGKRIQKFAKDEHSQQLAELIGKTDGQIWRGLSGIQLSWKGL
ncbi:hypothetical protein HA052_19815 [Chromobacterium haemolyticum]|uniref:Uncharacterized protein n=1 Tax=Chromobacterium fluminis TaxID=3044269 RepID=A0ABX0LJS0_9NEIS|nr:hypothetical protein [Chromobacterium haemolyticum]NHR07442.1 hypothetical protein [Chromobacterium haemolyticum]